MRLVYLVAMAVGLQGCAEQLQRTDPGLRPHCVDVAMHRAAEAGYGGEDSDTQRAVYDSVFAECTLWQKKVAG